MKLRLLQIGSRIISKYMPLWIMFCALVAFLFPVFFFPIQGFTEIGLGIIFLLMGLSLSAEKLFTIIRKPKNVLIGVALKWSIMVTVTVGIAFLFFRHSEELATGIILAGTVPSGTSANVYTFIAGGEAALSLTMATLDTFISPILTPYLVQSFAGKLIHIAFWPMFFNILYVVFLPLILGLVIQWKFTNQVEAIRPHTPILSQLSLFVIVLSVVSSAQESLSSNLSILPILFLAVFLQVFIPMVSGYWIARWLKMERPNAIAILFHTGICNSALAATLAMEHISSLSAVPAVANMVMNLTLGAIAANFFSHRVRLQEQEENRIRTN